MQPFDPNKKRLPTPLARPEGTQVGSLTLIPGSGADRIAKTVGGFVDNIAARREAYESTPLPGPVNTGLPSATRPVAPSPLRKPIVSPHPAGVPAPTVRPNFAGVQGTMRAAVPPVLRPGDVNTYTGTNGVTRAVEASVAPAAVARPALTAPVIAPVGSSATTAQTENTDQRRAREAAISEIGSQLFLNRGKTTSSARDLTSDLLRTQADLTNTAGNQAVALKNNNLDQQTRADMLPMQQNGENSRAVIGEQGANDRVAYHDSGETERTRLQLARPATITDGDGNLLSISQGVARPILNDGKPVVAARTKADGSVTDQDRYKAISEQLSVVMKSLGEVPPADTTDPRLAQQTELQQRLAAFDAIGSGGVQKLSIRPATFADFLAKARIANPNTSDADLKAYYDKTYGGERMGGAP